MKAAVVPSFDTPPQYADFPDPTANGIEIPIRKGMPTDLDPNNPRFQAAEKACQRFGP